MTNFTPEELIQYLYNEVSAKKAAAIEYALKEDWTLQEKLAVLKCSMRRLEQTAVSPRTEVVMNIFNYARESSIEEVQ